MPNSKITFQLEIIKRHDAYIATANTKAGMILSFSIAFISVLIATTPIFWSLNNSQWYKSSITIIALILFIGLLTSIIKSFFAIFPNVTRGANESLISFVHTSSFDGGAEAYFQAVKSGSDDATLKDLCYQSFILSEIARDKFSQIKTAVNAIKFSSLAATALIICIIAGSVVEHNMSIVPSAPSAEGKASE